MNKYYEMLRNVIENGREQRNKKGNIRYLTNEVMRLDAGDLLDIFESHGIARKKLRSELDLFCRGERNTEAYREAGISWWDYCGPILVNSYPTYFERLANIGRTNEMLRALRPIVAGVPHKLRIDEPVRSQVVAEVARWAKSGYVDWFSLSSNLHFAMNYSHNFEEFCKQTLYNRVRQDDYDVEGYLEGVETVSMDYRRLFDRFRMVPEVIFVLDPPYLSTDCGTYKSDNYWKLSDYLDVLKCLQGTRFVYFTSSKSTIVELADWMGRNRTLGNPFEGAKVHRFHVGGVCLSYDDMMLVKAA